MLQNFDIDTHLQIDKYICMIHTYR